LRSAKVIGVHRTDRGRFAVDLEGHWQSGKGGVIVTARDIDSGPSAVLLAGYLNSELLDLWYAVRGRTPWHVRRDYEPKPMSRIPYRHVALARGRVTEKVKAVKKALRDAKVDVAVTVAGAIAEELRAAGEKGSRDDAPEAVQAGQALEVLVEAIADNRRALLPFRERFPALGRVIKDPWSAEIVDPDVRAFVNALPKKKRASVRVDPELHISLDTDGMLGGAQMEGGTGLPLPPPGGRAGHRTAGTADLPRRTLLRSSPTLLR
jgi:hypothetical protein